MGDFLSRLADRTIGEAPVARPRLVSAFDPGLLPRRDPEVGDGPVGMDAERAAVFPVSRGGLQQPPAARSAPAAIGEPRRAEAEGHMPLGVPSTRGEPLTRPAPRTAADQASDPGPDRAATLPAFPAPALGAPAVELTDPPSRRPPPPRLVPLPEEDAASPARSLPLASEAVAPALPRPGDRASPARRVEREPPSSAPPAIHVSIGRIDVRAATPPAAAQSAPRAERRSTLMSLEDYLKRGQG